MPTIDQLTPAAAASDTDELMISQNGVSRKITRAGLVAGLQTQITSAPGTLLGNPSTSATAPSAISIGSNLTLQGGTLSATGAPYVVAELPTGTVPASTDLIALAQNGANTAITYAQFMSGLSAVSNVDISKLAVVPSGSGSTMTLGALAATAMYQTGSTMTGALTLAADPVQPLQAATKQYVDAAAASALPRTGGTLSGPLTLAAAPQQPLQAATKAYVDATAAGYLTKAGGTLTGELTLSADPAQPLDAATRRYVDAGDAANSSAVAAEALARSAADSTLQASLSQAQATAQAAQTSATSAQTAATTALSAATSAQTAATAALASVTTTQTTSTVALPATGGAMSGNLLIPNNYVYAGSDDFAAVRAQGRPTDGKAMLYVNKVGSSPTDSSLISSYYYVNDTGGSGSPRLVNNLQANVVSTPVSGIWLTHLGVTSAAVGGNQGLNGHLAADLQAVRDVASPIGKTTVQTSLSSAGPVLLVNDLTNFGQAPITSGTAAGTLTSIVNAAPLATVSTTACVAGATTIQVASTTGILAGMFCWGSGFAGYVTSTASNSVTLSNALQAAVPSGSAINAGWALLVKVGAHFYHLVSVSATNGPGSMTFGQSVTSSDAVSGNPVVSAQGGAPLWAFVAEIQDHTNLSSSAGGFAQIGELDISGNGDDDGPNAFVYSPTTGSNVPQGGRCFLSFVASKYNANGPDFVVNSGLTFTTTSGASVNSLFLPNIKFNTALLDARLAVASAATSNAIWLADGHRLAFSTDGSASIAYDSGTTSLRVAGQVRFGAPPVFPNYAVAALPASPASGAKAYASNGRKPGEAAGAGSGVEVFADSTARWISVLSGTPVQA